MQPWAWVLLVIVVVVLAVAIWAAARQRRTTSLRERFGPEYDRTVEATDDRRGAEQALRDRARRRDRLNIVALPEDARARYAGQWRAIQERFIDDPAGSVGSAHTLLDQVMAERGYPTRSFEEQADLVSVDHPQVVEDYRAAYAVYGRQQEGQASTEDLRNALVRYRSLFDELLRPEDGAADRRTDLPSDRRAEEVDGPAETAPDMRAATERRDAYSGVGDDVDSGDGRLPVRGADAGREHAHGRRLAGPVRAEEPEHLARLHREGDAVDGVDLRLRVALDEPAHGDGGGGRDRRRMTHDAEARASGCAGRDDW
jgi:hypothetical protein